MCIELAERDGRARPEPASASGTRQTGNMLRSSLTSLRRLVRKCRNGSGGRLSDILNGNSERTAKKKPLEVRGLARGEAVEEEEEMVASGAGSLVTSPESVLRVEAEDGVVAGDKGKFTGYTMPCLYSIILLMFCSIKSVISLLCP